jgi:GTP cyclohydrolase III
MVGDAYLLIDGDKVGETIDLFVLQNDLEGLARFTDALDAAVARIADLARSMGGSVHMAGGDNVLARLPDAEAFLARLPDAVAGTPCTFSVGIGLDARHAHDALLVAKAGAAGSIVRASGDGADVTFLAQAPDGAWVSA